VLIVPVPVKNVLVGHVSALMPDWNIFRNWYLGRGSFIQRNPDTQSFVNAYFNEPHATVAMGTLCSATERLLRAALKAEGIPGKMLTATLPHVLKFCVSADQRFFNLPGMCCDIRSIFRVNSMRKAAEHGTYHQDQRELYKGNWKPQDADEDYLKIIEHRLLGASSMVARIFDEVDPNTGLFLRRWEAREFARCPMAHGDFPSAQHDKDGRLPDEEPGEAEISE
jgi:hypothetical protein